MSSWLKMRDIPEGPPPGESPDAVLKVVISPYDFPDAVRAFRTPSGKARVEFRYIDGAEGEKTIHVNENLVVFEGEHSGRILAMELNIDALGVRNCGVAIEAGHAQHDARRLEESLDMAWRDLADRGSHSEEDLAVTRAIQGALESRKNALVAELVRPWKK